MAKKTIIVVSLVALALASVHFADAQQAKKLPVIGHLASSAASFILPRLNAFREGLRDLRYVEGKSISVEYRYAEGKLDRLPDLAAELVRLKVDLIFAIGDPGISAAKQPTKTIPIAFIPASAYPN